MQESEVNRSECPAEPCLAQPQPARDVGAGQCVPLQNKIEVVGGQLIVNNGAAVGIAMTERRIRVGCTEISLEAAKRIMDFHRSRFGEVDREEVMQ